MRQVLSRLRWQLTLSHLAAIAVTLVSLIAAVVVIAGNWWSSQHAPTREPAQDARLVAQAAGGLIRTGSVSEISGVLRSFSNGNLQIVAQWGPPGNGLEPSHLAYIVAIGDDGRILGSSDPSGATFAPPERQEWVPLADQAFAGAGGDVMVERTSGGPSALGAAPVLDDQGRPTAAVVVALRSTPSQSETPFWQALALFGVATIVVLAASSLFAIASSSLVSYLLARQLVRRLERLGSAAEAFAAGDLTRRVDERTSNDEVGQLARRFNDMADRLADTLEELGKAKERAEAALEAKRQLVANVSHELRTPMASIRAHTESLLLCRDDEMQAGSRRDYLDVIHRQTEQLSGLIDDLFLISTTESGALPLTLRPMALDEVIDEVVNSIDNAARVERRVSVLAKVEPHLPLVLADRQRVGQVLANLVRNAVRYTPEGGLVAVRATRRDDRCALVSVEDTGVGIPPDELEHIFERFYRADASRDRATGGTGLGLAIVRELVSAMGGEVSAESTLGEGSRFSFTLPLAGVAGVFNGAPRRERATTP